MKTYWIILAMSCLLLIGCSCGEKTDEGNRPLEQEPISGSVNNSGPLFMAFKEIRFELSPETPAVGQIVEYRIHLVPVDDLNSVRHPWIDKMRRNIDPNFSIKGLVYWVEYGIGGTRGERSKDDVLCDGHEFISAISQVRQNAVYAAGQYEDIGAGYWGSINNLILDNQSDTITVKMRFNNPGKHEVRAAVMFNAPHYVGTSTVIPMNGTGGQNSLFFMVREQ